MHLKTLRAQICETDTRRRNRSRSKLGRHNNSFGGFVQNLMKMYYFGPDEVVNRPTNIKEYGNMYGVNLHTSVVEYKMLLLGQGIWRLKNHGKYYKFSCFPKSQQPKKAQNLSKSINFYAPQKYPNICRPPKIGHTKKQGKILQKT